jgi:hypothetical protein
MDSAAHSFAKNANEWGTKLGFAPVRLWRCGRERARLISQPGVVSIRRRRGPWLNYYCAVPPMTVPLSVSISNSSWPPLTKTELKLSADDPLGVICSVPVQSDASV